MHGPSPAQVKVLTILYWLLAAGEVVTIRDLARMTGTKSSHNMYEHLGRLQKKGYVTWERGKAATYRVTEKGADFMRQRVVRVEESALSELARMAVLERA